MEVIPYILLYASLYALIFVLARVADQTLSRLHEKKGVSRALHREQGRSEELEAARQAVLQETHDLEPLSAGSHVILLIGPTLPSVPPEMSARPLSTGRSGAKGEMTP